MAMIDAFKNLPDVSFIENKTVEQIKAEMAADFESYMTAATGTPYTLPRVSERRFELYAAAAKIYQAMQYTDRAGKRNLLKYSDGAFLENLAIMKDVHRLPASAAVTTLRFTAAAVRTSAIGIPAGTRVSTSNGKIYFAVDEYTEIPAGGSSVDVSATCTVPGLVGNDLAAGALRVIVDPAPYVGSVTNLTATEGGADVESDESLTERVYLAPGAYSTAGPEAGYIYHAKSYSTSVGDVQATSDQQAGTVDLVFLMQDGSDPGQEMIDGMLEYISSQEKRPMSDALTVSAPAAVNYGISLTYYINQSESAQAMEIQARVQQAVQDYQTWQRKIGRDINPDELRYRLRAAGAKRAEITAPLYTIVPKTAVASLSGEAVLTYGGLEDD